MTRKAFFSWLLCFCICISLCACRGKGDAGSSAIAANESGSSSPSVAEIESQNTASRAQSSAKNSSRRGASSKTASRQTRSTSAESSAQSSAKTPSQQSASEVASDYADALSDFKVYNRLNPITPENYYGRRILQQTGSEAELRAYDLFVSQIGKIKKEITFDFEITVDEMKRACAFYWEDWPQHFWRGNQYELIKSGNKALSMRLTGMTESRGTVMRQVRALERRVNNILKKINGSMSAFERERLIHDELVNTVEYDTILAFPNTHDLYGTLVNGVAVCEGYALAFQYLMREAGVQCILVKGTLDVPNGPRRSHAWNMVELDGEFYHVDVTADDPVVSEMEGILQFNYFNVTDERILRDHTISEELFALPKAVSEENEFFVKNDLVLEQLSVEQMARAYVFSVKRRYSLVHIRLTSGSVDDVVAFMQRNIHEVVKRANSILGREMLSVGEQVEFINDELNLICSIKLYD